MSLREKAVWIPAAAVILAAAIGVVGKVIEAVGVNRVFEAESDMVRKALELPADERAERICALHRSELQSGRVAERVAKMAGRDPRCTEHGYLAEVPDVPVEVRAGVESEADRKRLNECLRRYAAVTAECTATDQSAYHSRPSASCELVLEAGDGRFFAQGEVTVVSERYRKLDGSPARGAVGAQAPDDGLIRMFKGRIKCTNDKGIGRTCVAEAKVKALAYPESCGTLRGFLREARQGAGVGG